MGIVQRHREAAVINRILGGHREEFAYLVQRYEPLVRSVAYAAVPNATTAEEATQEAFTQAYLKLGTLRETGRFGPWICAIARNAAFMLQRRQSREVPLDDSVPEPAHDTSEAMERREFHLAVRTKLSELSPEQREVLLMHYFAGKSTREMAEVMGISRAAVKKRLERARAAMADLVLKDIEGALSGGKTPAARNRRLMAAVLLLPAPQHQVPLPAGSAWAWAWPSPAVVLSVVASSVLVVAALLTLAASRESSKEILAAPVSPSPGDSGQAAEAVSPQQQTASGASVAPDLAPASPTAPAKPASIEGRVLDAVTKAPIPNAKYSATLQEKAEAEKVEMFSDKDGVLRFFDLPPGNYLLKRENTPEGYREVSFADDGVKMSLAPAKPLSGLTFEIGREALVSGVVLGPDNLPVAGAAIACAGGQEVYQTRDGTTDAQGRFSFHGLNPTRDMWVSTHKDVLTARNVGFDLPPEGRTDLELHLEEGGSISGAVVNSQGAPVAGIVVAAEQPNSRLVGGAGAISDAAGKFTIEHVPAGDYDLGAFKKGSNIPWKETTKVELEAGEKLAGMTLIFDEPVSGSIAGSVRDSRGQLMAGVKVRTSDRSTRATTDAAGAYHLEGLSGDVQDVEIETPGYLPGRLRAVPTGTTAANFVLYPLPVQSLKGRVVDADTGNPIPNFELAWSPMQQVEKDEAPLHFSTRFITEWNAFTDADGQFELPLQIYYPVDEIALFAQSPVFAPLRRS